MTVFQPRWIFPDSSTDRGKIWRVAPSGSGDGNEFLELVDLSAANVSGLAEAIDDRVAALLTEGTGIDLTYNDSGGTLTIDVTGGGLTETQVYQLTQFWS